MRKRIAEDEKRRHARPRPLTRTLRGIRIYSSFGRKALYPHDFLHGEIFSNLLRRYGLKTPGYDEIYIRLGRTLEEAKTERALLAWHCYTYATVDFDRFKRASGRTKSKMMLDAVRQGLMHIAKVDHLDPAPIRLALRDVEREGIGVRLTWTRTETTRYKAAVQYQVAPYLQPATFHLLLQSKESGREARGPLFTCPFEPSAITYLLGGLKIARDRLRIVPRTSLRAQVWLENFNVKGKREIDLESFLSKFPI